MERQLFIAFATTTEILHRPLTSSSLCRERRYAGVTSQFRLLAFDLRMLNADNGSRLPPLQALFQTEEAAAAGSSSELLSTVDCRRSDLQRSGALLWSIQATTCSLSELLSRSRSSVHRTSAGGNNLYVMARGVVIDDGCGTIVATAATDVGC